jgi:hypothetical protein
MFKGGETPAERAVVAMLECQVRRWSMISIIEFYTGSGVCSIS